MVQQDIKDICLCHLEFVELNCGNKTLQNRHMTNNEGGGKIVFRSNNKQNQTVMVEVIISCS